MQTLPIYAMEGELPWLYVAAQYLRKGFAPGSTKLGLHKENQCLQHAAQHNTAGEIHQAPTARVFCSPTAPYQH